MEDHALMTIIDLDRNKYLRKSGIYAIVNIETYQWYIGSTIDLYGRYLLHRRNLVNGKHDNFHLQNSWNKYGADSFEFWVMFYYEDIEEVKLRWIENLLIKDHNTMDDVRGFNRVLMDENHRYYRGGVKYPTRAKEVVSYNVNTGEIKEYPEMKAVSKTGNIGKSISARSITNGCFWFYKDSFSLAELKQSFKWRHELAVKDWITYRNDFYLDMETGIYYNSSKALAFSLGIQYRTLKNRLRTNAYYQDRFLILEK